MRTLPLTLILFSACASAPAGPTRDVTVSRDAPATGRLPSDAYAHVAEVFVGTTCEDLDAGKAAKHRTGFYVNPRTIATDAMLYELGGGAIFPDFVVVDALGCHKAQYGDYYGDFGLLFLRVYDRHEGAMALEDGYASPRMAALRYEGRNADGSAKSASAIHELPTRSNALAGSPIFNAEGRCVAMVSSGMIDDDFGIKPRAMTISAVRVSRLLASCGPCEDD